MMPITPEHLRQYQDEGYTVIRGFLSEEDLAPLRARMLEILEGNHDWPPAHFQILNPEEYRSARGGPVPWGIQTPSRREDVFSRIACHERLQGAMQALLGGPVELFTDQALVRNGRVQGCQSFYHQDSWYWRLQPERGCNAWITLNPVGRGAGALAIMPGTHRDWSLVEHEDYYDEPSVHSAASGKAFQRHRIPAERIDFAREELLEMQTGDAAFFTNFTWHRAEPNLTGEHELAYAIAYRLRDDES